MRNGGHLVLGPRSGMKDADNALWPQRQPGPLAALLGAAVEQYYALDAPVHLSGEAGTGEALIWAESLQVQAADAHVWMTYDAHQGWLSGKPAVVTRRAGKGSLTYIGAWLAPGLMQQVEDRLLTEAGLTPVVPGLPSPAEIEICERTGNGRRILIVINHGDAAQTVTLPARVRTSLIGTGHGNTLQLDAHDVGVVELTSPPATEGR